jgi:hypothetical protein
VVHRPAVASSDSDAGREGERRDRVGSRFVQSSPCKFSICGF